MSERLSGRRIGLLTASASRLAGGMLESTINQATMIRSLGGTPVVFALEDAYSNADRARFGSTEVQTAKILGPAQIGYSPQLGRMLRAAQLDCLHLQGIWMYPSAAGADWAKVTGRPYVISPRGMLDSWILARSKWKKTLARIGYERRSWSAAAQFHALSLDEAADIARATGSEGALVIPNAAPKASKSPNLARSNSFIYLGRIHPKKNIDRLIDAWTKLTAIDRLPAQARLIIAGWGEPAHVTELESKLANAPDSIVFNGPAFGSQKQELLQSGRFLILPSLSEGLPNAVLEAWAAGTPTLMSAACHLPEGLAGGAALDCGIEVSSIAETLVAAATLEDSTWLAMAKAAQSIAAGPFAAETIAARWGEAYAALMEQGQ